MKMLTGIVLMFLSGCAVVENMSRNCNGDELCMILFGSNPAEQERIAEDVELLKKRMAAVESKTSYLTWLIGDVENNLRLELGEDITEKVAGLNDMIGREVGIINTTINGKTNWTKLNTFINTQLDDIVSSVATFNSYNTVTQIISPCGITTGWYEVVLRTSGGDYLAYFEQGGNRFLVKLQRGTDYSTTDGRGCNFRVKTDGTIKQGHGE